MPAEQRGSAYRLGPRRWGVRWWENGVRKLQSGFPSKSVALAYYRDEVRPRLGCATTVDGTYTFDAFCDLFIAAYAGTRSPRSVATLRERLAPVRAEFGDVRLADLERRAPEIAAWRATLPEGSRYRVMRAFRQALAAAEQWGAILRNPAVLAGPNPAPRVEEVVPFARDEVDALAVELGPVSGPLVVFAAETGLRPQEWQALEHRDVMRSDGVVLVERVLAGGEVRPLPQDPRLAAAGPPLRPGSGRRPPGIGGPIWAAPGGGYLELNNWRRREWRPAYDAAGLAPGRTIYGLRHTFATNALAAGIGLYELARWMGTSVRMIDRTYGHLAPGSEAAAREKLNVWASIGRDAASGGSGD